MKHSKSLSLLNNFDLRGAIPKKNRENLVKIHKECLGGKKKSDENYQFQFGIRQT